MKAYPSFDGVYVWRRVNLSDCRNLEYYGSKAKYQNQANIFPDYLLPCFSIPLSFIYARILLAWSLQSLFNT